MFSVTAVVKRGWWNSAVTVAADQEIDHQEKRLRYHGMRIARVETWRLRIEAGETFTIKLPASVGANMGDKLSLETIKNERALRGNWMKVETF